MLRRCIAFRFLCIWFPFCFYCIFDANLKIIESSDHHSLVHLEIGFCSESTKVPRHRWIPDERPINWCFSIPEFSFRPFDFRHVTPIIMGPPHAFVRTCIRRILFALCANLWQKSCFWMNVETCDNFSLNVVHLSHGAHNTHDVSIARERQHMRWKTTAEWCTQMFRVINKINGFVMLFTRSND